MRKFLIVLAWKLKGLNVNKLFVELKQKESWSTKEWREHQNLLFLEFVKYCYEKVPYYKKLFDSINLKLDDIL